MSDYERQSRTRCAASTPPSEQRIRPRRQERTETMNELTELQVKLLRSASERDVNGALVPIKATWQKGNCYVCLDIFKDNVTEANLESETVSPLISNGFLRIVTTNKAGKTLCLTAAGIRALKEYDDRQAAIGHQ